VVTYIGHIGTNDKATPQLVEALLGKHIVSVACGRFHTVAMTSQGDVYAWGGSDNGQLGHGTTDVEPKPILVESLRGKNVIQIVTGDDFTMAVTGNYLYVCVTNIERWRIVVLLGIGRSRTGMKIFFKENLL
jgi:alpha-tubulin suppressor-like RCC1 family protein